MRFPEEPAILSRGLRLTCVVFFLETKEESKLIVSATLRPAADNEDRTAYLE
jgi:hypothetical protein